MKFSYYIHLKSCSFVYFFTCSNSKFHLTFILSPYFFFNFNFHHYFMIQTKTKQKSFILSLNIYLDNFSFQNRKKLFFFGGINIVARNYDFHHLMIFLSKLILKKKTTHILVFLLNYIIQKKNNIKKKWNHPNQQQETWNSLTIWKAKRRRPTKRPPFPMAQFHRHRRRCHLLPPLY